MRLCATSGPIFGMANPPSWPNRLGGGPAVRCIARLIGSWVFQSASVSRIAIKVVSGVVCRWFFSPGAAGAPLTVITNERSGARSSWLPLSTAAVVPVVPVRTLKLACGSFSGRCPVITYCEA